MTKKRAGSASEGRVYPSVARTSGSFVLARRNQGEVGFVGVVFKGRPEGV